MRPPEHSPERDAALEALLPNVPFDGWTRTALRNSLAAAGESPDDADHLFPGGAAEMIEAWCDLADRRMAEAAGPLGLSELRVPERVRALIALRLEQARPHKEAVRRALALLSLPQNALRAARITARTADAIWRAAGDTATDLSRHTKRATLAAIYSATLLAWLRDRSEDDAATLAFLDRRLAGIGRIGGMRRQVEALAVRLPFPRRPFSRREHA